jgi:FkbM family methyltransferase
VSISSAKKLFRDFYGLVRVLGFNYAIRWIFTIPFRFREILASKDLQSLDRAMGIGPFRVRMRKSGVEFQVIGSGAFSGIREMYVRDVYLKGGILEIEDGDVVMDLGANMGNFTNLALAHGEKIRVIAVEPNSRSNDHFWKSLSLNNGFKERVTLFRSFLGETNGSQSKIDQGVDYEGATEISESELLNVSKIDHIDFLKCDIEGGEFNLLGSRSRLLKMARNLAIEIHSFAGDVDLFIEMLSTQGFQIKHVQRDPDGTATVLASR